MPVEKVRSLQDRLYTTAKSGPKRRFYSLRDKVYRKDILEQAWKDVKENHGVPGPDGVTLQDIEDGGVDAFLADLGDELRGGTYCPGPVLRVFIPKPSGGERPLGIPNVRDRVVQAAVKLVIEPIFEADFEPCSFGFRPGKSAHDALREAYKWLNFGLDKVVDVDIEQCFDEIPHGGLLKALARRIADGYILKLIRAWLKAPVMWNGTLASVNKGTPQGGVISPLLANVYLHQIDEEWKRRGMTNRYTWNAQLVRYADDLVILTNRSPEKVLDILREVLIRFGLRLSDRKTRLVPAKDGFDFLGFRFIRRFSRKWGKEKTYYSPSPASVTRMKGKVRERVNNHVLHVPPEELVGALNSLVVGWRNYFRHSNASRAFSKIDNYLLYRFRKYLRRRKNVKGVGKYRDSPDSQLVENFGLELCSGSPVSYRVIAAV